MIVSLPMYDWPELKEPVDRFWQQMRAELLPLCPELPLKLDRSDYRTQWQSSELALSQTCGYPLVTALPTNTIVLGTPEFSLTNCNNAHYASPIVVHKSNQAKRLQDFRGATLAFNSTDSQSGFNSLRNLLFDSTLIDEHNPVYFNSGVCTGSHRNSIAAVATGDADIAAIDPVSWALSNQFDQDASDLRVIAQTSFTPALPLICHPDAVPNGLSEDAWRNAILRAFEKINRKESHKQLLYSGIRYIPKSEYFEVPILPFTIVTI